MLDTRFTGQARLDDLENSSLIDVSSKIAMRVRDKTNGKDSYEVAEFGEDVERLLETAGAMHPQTLQSLQGLVDWSVSRDASDLASFRSLWGRGQQYISLVRMGCVR